MQGEDLVCHIYSVVALIDEVRRKGQKVLVHCTQGVSRSCSFCIAYLMLLEKISYDDGAVRARTHACTLFPSHTRSSGGGGGGGGGGVGVFSLCAWCVSCVCKCCSPRVLGAPLRRVSMRRRPHACRRIGGVCCANPLLMRSFNLLPIRYAARPCPYIRHTHHRAGDTGFQRLKARRGICNPNPGFCSQLVRWGRRVLQADKVSADAPLQYTPRIFRVDFYYPANKKVRAPRPLFLLAAPRASVPVRSWVCPYLYMYITPAPPPSLPSRPLSADASARAHTH